MYISAITALLLGLDFAIASPTPTTQTDSDATSATATSACTGSSLPATFKIKNNSTSSDNFYYVDVPSGNEILTTTEACASVFYVDNVCQSPQLCGIPTLTYNYTIDGNTTSYGAYNSGSDGPITVSAEEQSAGNIQPEASSGCELRFIPFLDHDFIYTFNCEGALSLGNFPTLQGCQAVELQYVAA
nr:hypothetical protein CFP56_43859 [Quercus suber]